MHCIMGTPPPFLQGGRGRGGGLSLQANFQKEGGLTGPQLLEIFNDKKSL